MENIINILGSKDIKRIRIGIGKKTFPNVKDYVLSTFNHDEIELMNCAFTQAANASIDFITESFPNIMTRYNKK
jgi:PTH1 family peptidyl-tRNA hydrolase